MREPPRLRDGTEEPLAATLLDAARGYRRPATSRHRILRMLGLPIGAAAAAPAVAGVSASLATKVVLLVSAATVIAGGGAVAYQVHVRSHGPTHVRAAQVSPAPSRSGTAASRPQNEVAPTASVAALDPALRDPRVAEVARVEGSSSSIEAPVRSPTRTPLARRRRLPPAPLLVRPSSGASPVAQAFTQAPPAVLAPASTFTPRATEPPPAVAMASAGQSPATSARGERLAMRAPPASFPAASPPPARAPLAREMSLLDDAERAGRRKDYGSALASLDAYERAFPDGVLAAEAQVLRISALLGSGNETAARERARLFLDHYAPSPLAARVKAMLAGRSRQTKELP